MPMMVWMMDESRTGRRRINSPIAIISAEDITIWVRIFPASTGLDTHRCGNTHWARKGPVIGAELCTNVMVSIISTISLISCFISDLLMA